MAARIANKQIKFIGALLPENSGFSLPWHRQALLLAVFAAFALVPYMKIYIPAGLALLAAVNCIRLAPSRYADKKAYFFLALISLLCCSAVLSSYVMPTGLHRGGGTIFLWFAFFVSGFCLSREIPGHDYYFLNPVPLLLFLGVGGVLLLWYAGVMNPFYGGKLYRFQYFYLRAFRLELYAGLLLLFSCSCFFYAANARQRARYIATIAGLAGIVLLGGFRSPLFALALPLLLLFLKAPASKKVKSALLVFFTGLILLYVAVMPHERRHHLQAAVTRPLEVPSIHSRMPIWETAIRLLEQSPFFGHGVDSFRILHPQYIAAHKVELKKKYRVVEDSRGHPHNFLLGKLVALGWVGTMFFLTLFLCGLALSLRAPPRQFWLGCLILFYCIVGIVDDPMAGWADSYLFLFVGLACGFPMRTQRL